MTENFDSEKVEAGIEAAYNARQETVKLLREKGPKLGRVLFRLRQALNAKETKFFAHQGEVIDQKDVIAHNIRLRAVDLALQLHDAMPSQKHEITGKLENESNKELDNPIQLLIGQTDANSD